MNTQGAIFIRAPLFDGEGNQTRAGHVAISEGNGYVINAYDEVHDVTHSNISTDPAHFNNPSIFQTYLIVGMQTGDTSAPHDFNADGTSDILVRRISDGYLVYGQTQNGTIPAANWRNLSPMSTDWNVAGVGDLNGDGQSDEHLVRRISDGFLGYGHVQNGAISAADWHNISSMSTDWNVAGIGDFNGDGQSDDILVRRISDGYLVYGHVENSSIGATAWHNISPMSTDWNVAGVGDFNGDGRVDDILVRRISDGYLVYGHVQNGTIAATAWQNLSSMSTAWNVANVGEYDGDGASNDILVRRISDGYLVYGHVQNGTIAPTAWHNVSPMSTDWLVVA